jgi:hypothetical protein
MFVIRLPLTIEVWEHAYYLDYYNRRIDHVNAVLDKPNQLGICAAKFACCVARLTHIDLI